MDREDFVGDGAHDHESKRLGRKEFRDCYSNCPTCLGSIRFNALFAALKPDLDSFEELKLDQKPGRVLPQEILAVQLFELNLLSGVVIVMDEQQRGSPSARPPPSAPTVVGDSSNPFRTRRDEDLSDDKENWDINIERTMSDDESSASGSQDTVPAHIAKTNNDKISLTIPVTPTGIITYHRRRKVLASAVQGRGGNPQKVATPPQIQSQTQTQVTRQTLEPQEAGRPVRLKVLARSKAKTAEKNRASGLFSHLADAIRRENEELFNIQLLVKPFGRSLTDPGLPQLYLSCPPLITIKQLAEYMASTIPTLKGKKIEFLVPRPIHRRKDSNLWPLGISDKQDLHVECTLDYAWSKLWEGLGDLVLEYREALHD